MEKTGRLVIRLPIGGFIFHSTMTFNIFVTSLIDSPGFFESIQNADSTSSATNVNPLYDNKLSTRKIVRGLRRLNCSSFVAQLQLVFLCKAIEHHGHERATHTVVSDAKRLS